MLSESSSDFDFNSNLKVEGSVQLADALYELCDFYQDYNQDDSINQKFSQEVKEWLLKLEELLEQDE